MTEEARLTDFVGAEDAEERRDESADADAGADSPPGDIAGPDREAEGEAEEVTADAMPTGADAETPVDPDSPSPEPAVATYAWEREATCGACGATAERRWRDGDRFVCATCKDW